MKAYKIKLDNLHRETIREGVADYLLFSTFKQWFNVPNTSLYQFNQLKSIILKFLKDKGLQA